MPTSFAAYSPIDISAGVPSCDPSYPEESHPPLPKLSILEQGPSTSPRPPASRTGSDDLDLDQKASELFLSPHPDSSHPLALSAPEPSHILSPLQENDSCASPAAMFLAGFSPLVHDTSLPDDEGQVVAGYTLGPVIAHGGFSVIRRASSLAGGTVAVKIVRRTDVAAQPKSAALRKKLAHETDIWSSLSHEHILPLFTSAHTAFADFFVMPFCPAGTLFDMLEREGKPALPQDDAGMLFRQVVRGLRYLHEAAQLVHRDMKLENVLVDDMGVCRITDFGMARYIGDVEEEEDPEPLANSQSMFVGAAGALRRNSTQIAPPRSLRERLHQKQGQRKASNPFPASYTPDAPQAFEPGSLPYAAPELLRPHDSPLPADPAQDMWALGVMLYALLVGRLPFMNSFEPRLQMMILHGSYDRPLNVGAEAERIIAGCLQRPVLDRWTIAMVDDVAWGVGWNAALDPSPEPEPARRSLSRSMVSSRSRSRSSSALRSRSPSGLCPPPILSPTSSMSSATSYAFMISPPQSIERGHVRPRSDSLPQTPQDAALPLPRSRSHKERGRKGFPSALVHVTEADSSDEEDMDVVSATPPYAYTPRMRRSPSKSSSVPAAPVVRVGRAASGRGSRASGRGWSPSRPRPEQAVTIASVDAKDDMFEATPKPIPIAPRSRSVGFSLRPRTTPRVTNDL